MQPVMTSSGTGTGKKKPTGKAGGQLVTNS
jgi:hypothetical protein